MDIAQIRQSDKLIYNLITLQTRVFIVTNSNCKPIFYFALLATVISCDFTLCMNQADNSQIILRKEELGDRFGTCFIVAATEILGITGQAPEKLPIAFPENIIETCKFLQYFDAAKKPSIGSLVAYVSESNDIDHLAIVTQAFPNSIELCRVKDKTGTNPYIMEHLINDVYDDFKKDTIMFFNLKKEFENKDYLLKLMQNDIQQSSKIKKALVQAKIILIALANGKNVSSSIFTGFNIQRSIYGKAFHLLKICMGLDVNTRTSKKRQTVTMLAAMRNDYNLVNLFLNMGANVNMQDINGNTALHLAAQHRPNNHDYDKVLGELLLSKNLDETIKNNDGLTAY